MEKRNIDYPEEKKNIVPSKPQPPLFENIQTREEMKAIWQGVFSVQWPETIRVLFQAHKENKMVQSYKVLKKQILVTFRGECEVKYFCFRCLSHDVRLECFDDLSGEWAQPCDNAYIVGRLFRSVTIFLVLISIFGTIQVCIQKVKICK